MESNASKASRKTRESTEDASERSAQEVLEEIKSVLGITDSEPPVEEDPLTMQEDPAAAVQNPAPAPPVAFKRAGAEQPVAPRRPVPSPPPAIKERPAAVMPTLAGHLEPADLSQLGARAPGREERRWIEAAIRRMFRSLGPAALEGLTEAFREWKLEPCTAIVRQQSPISTGPGLCVLFEGVVDVLHRPMGGQVNEKVCTYDRMGQCFGELELFYDAPRASTGAGRKLHWATIATRTPVTLWTISRDALRGNLHDAATPSLELSDKPKGPMSCV